MIQLADDGQVAEPQDAATVIVYRRHPELQIFMVKRHARSKFMANAMVFPGGRLESTDLDESWSDHLDITGEEAAHRLNEADIPKARGLLIAAIRETFEEAAILLMQQTEKSPPLDAPTLLGARDELNQRTATFLSQVKGWHLRLSTEALTYVSRWRTPAIEKRRYDARFFSIECPPNQSGQHDDLETTSSDWLSPDTALEQYSDGRIELAPPTLRILLTCATDPRWLWRPRATPITAIEPQARLDDGQLHLVLPGDPAFEPSGSTPNRVSRIHDRWVSVGTGA
ncbi:MAG: hypothetical protein VX589_04010 [Myxococcota bacterium]|nr:hypothetical protein [Myxococcota bacterium]